MRGLVHGLLCGVLVGALASAQPTERSSIMVTIRPDRAVFALRDTVTCQFVVENTGDLRIENLRATVNNGASIPLSQTSLDPGSYATGEKSYTLTLADLPGPFLIQVTAEGKDKYNRSVVANAYTHIPTAAVALTKTASPAKAEPGTEITYTFEIKNIGSTSLTLDEIVDDKLGPIDDLNGVELDAGASRTLVRTHALPDDPTGEVVNRATVYGRATVGGDSATVTATDDAAVQIIRPGMEEITLVKTVNPDQAFPGDTVTYTITVTNGDSVTRTFRLSDPLLKVNEEITLQSGKTWTKSFSYTIPADAPNQLVNVVTLQPKVGAGKLTAEARVRVVRLGTSPGDPDDPRNQPWDVSFAQVKVFDTQVLDGAECRLRILDGNYQPVTEIPLSGTLYVEVTDPDQNEDPRLREVIFGAWNRDAATGDNALGDPRSEHSYPIWPRSRTSTEDRLTPGKAFLAAASISGVAPTAKIFLWNAQNGSWELLSLRETAVGSGIFRSTTCIPVSGSASLNSSPGDTIIAFYQDPSNHSDIAIATVKVAEGGAGGVAPSPGPRVVFDSETYFPGAMLMVTVTDPAYAQSQEIRGSGVLVLKDAQDATLKSWDAISTVAGEAARFRVTWRLPAETPLGAVRAVYTDPADSSRTGRATAQVVAAGPEKVTGIAVTPNPFSTQTTFSLICEPVGARASKIRVSVYDLTGRRVGEIVEANVASVSWDGANLRNGAYIYAAVVETSIPVKRTWSFRGFVYIKR